MAIQFMSVKCPECGGNLSVESDREFAFCSYCGTKVMMNNENEHIYRTIDEAEIKHAETDRIVKMRQLDLEEKSDASRKGLMIVWLAAVAILIVVGIIGFSIGNTGMEICLMLAMIAGMYGYAEIIGNKKKRRTVTGSHEAAITESMTRCAGKHYNSAVMLFKSAGFRNVSAVPLHDLSLLTMRKNGQVDTVTIDGADDFEEGDVYPKDARIAIMYHSR